MKDKYNCEALRVFCFYLLAKENDLESFEEKFEELQKALQQSEPRNSDLYYNYARLFARFCGRNPAILKLTGQLLEQALAQQPENPSYLCEVGVQKAMVGDNTTAQTVYQRAASQDENNIQPLYGMIYCRIRQGDYDEAAQ